MGGVPGRWSVLPTPYMPVPAIWFPGSCRRPVRRDLAPHGPELDRSAGWQVLDLGGNDHPGVGGGQGVHHAGALGADGPDQTAVDLHPAMCSDQMQAARRLAERL